MTSKGLEYNYYYVATTSSNMTYKSHTTNYFLYIPSYRENCVHFVQDSNMECVCRLDILYSSNHNIHKNLCGDRFWGSDPLIDGF